MQYRGAKHRGVGYMVCSIVLYRMWCAESWCGYVVGSIRIVSMECAVSLCVVLYGVVYVVCSLLEWCILVCSFVVWSIWCAVSCRV